MSRIKKYCVSFLKKRQHISALFLVLLTTNAHCKFYVHGSGYFGEGATLADACQAWSDDANHPWYPYATMSDKGECFISKKPYRPSLWKYWDWIRSCPTGKSYIIEPFPINMAGVCCPIGTFRISHNACSSLFIATPPEESKNAQNNGESHCQAGNPVTIATGNKFQKERLIAIEGFDLYLHYNSRNKVNWTSSLSWFLSPLTHQDIKPYIQRPDGKVIYLQKVNDNQWQSSPKGLGSLTLSDKTYTYESNNTRVTFNKFRNMTRYQPNINHALVIEKSSAQFLIKIKDKVIATATLNAYNEITEVVFGDNKTTLQYSGSIDNRLLTSISRNGKLQKQFIYEQSKLVGITDGNGARYASWAYDEQGRVISSEHAGGTEHFSFEYPAENQTLVTNPLGKKTHYYFNDFNGLKLISKVEGQQTEHCAAANKAYTYYDNGLLKTKTDWKGMVTAFEYNDRGLETRRTVAFGTSSQYEVVTEWHDTLRLPTAKITHGERVEYHYDDKGRLIDKGDASE